jgi:putative FmdB family regulatory protein
VFVPVYVYRCADCGDQTEVMQRMSDDPLTVCSACAGQITRVLFAPAIHFKGTGFHNTDYASKKRPGAGDGGGDGGAKSDGGDGAAKSDNGSSGSSDNGSGGGGDSAPATKTESAPAKKTVGLDKA